MARPERDRSVFSADDSWPLDDAVVEADVVIDCDTCDVRGIACDDCVISALLGGPPDADDGRDNGPLSMAPVEVRALGALAEGGLLPPLRLRPRATEK